MLLVTGITGHTGGFFLQELIGHHYSGVIRCIVRPDSDTRALDASGLAVEKCTGDLKDPEFIRNCLQGVDTVFHITNIRYTLNLLRQSIAANVKRMICVHTTGIYSQFRQASSEYLEIESQIQSLIKDKPLRLTILRPTMIFGDQMDHNISKFIRAIDRLRIFPVIGSGQALLQPVNARDLGRAYYQVLSADPDALKPDYILSGEKPLPIIDLYRRISQELGKRTLFIHLPLSLGVMTAQLIRLMSFNRINVVEKVQRMSENRAFSHDEATRDFNYQPASFDAGLAYEVREYQQRHTSTP